jgi:TP901 family phage tail tape measure protein
VSVVANVAINVDSSNAVSKLKQVNDAGSKLEQTLKGVDGKLRDSSGRFIKLGDSAQASTGKINVLARALSNLGTGLAVADAARRYFKGFNEAEKAAAAVRTLGVDSKALEGNLLGLSQKLGGLYSQTQLLTAAYDVASSGFANAADNTKVLEAAAKGATGGLSDIGTVGNAVTSVLNAYGKSADEAASLVDGFIQTQNDGKIILNEYAGYIGKLAPTAKAAGVGINEMNAAIATITAQGVPVEATFTGLNQALVSILKPSQEAEELAKSLGIQFNEAGLRAKGFGGLLEEVKTKTGGSTTQLVKLFGSVDALKAILPLVNDDLVKYNQNVVKQANASGVAEKATQELGGTVSSEISKMINQIGNLTRALDTVLGPSLGGIVRLINFVIAEATKGIQVLGQLFSMSPNKMIAQQAVQSGQIGAAPRTLAGIDETIGEKRRKSLQQQAGAGTGFLGLGMNTEKFMKLLKQQPEFKSPVASKPTLPTLPNALNTPLGATVGGASTGRGGGASKAANDAKRAAEDAARESQRVADVVRDQEFITKQKGIQTKFAQLIFEAEQAADPIRARQLQTVEALVLAGNETARLLEEETNRTAQLAIARTRQGEAEAIRQEGMLAVLDLQLQQQKNFDEIITGLDLELALKTATTEQAREQLRLEAEIAKLKGEGFTPEQIGAITAKKTELAAPKTDQQNITEKIGTLKDEIADLTSISNIAITSAEGIGNAFAQSFQGLISGTMTAKEALGSFFKSVADMFLEMAAQIIAKQMTMIILQTILKALGAISGGTQSAGSAAGAKAFGGSGPKFNPGAFSMPKLAANGATFANGIAQFASGGVVSSPTLFKFADGGTTRTGLMGEAGPEAIMPLKRGPDGSLGVQANGLREAMGRPPGATSKAPVLNMKFETTSINGVEYVSRDQLESAMAVTRRQAANDGASRGMNMTLDKIQNSPSTRARVGIR